MIPFLLTACGPAVQSTGRTDNEFDEETDEINPVIVHETIDGASLPMGEDIPLTALVTDDTAVFTVRLFYKEETAGSAEWIVGTMMPTGTEDEYGAVIPASEQEGAGMNYYLEAIDTAQNTVWAPTQGADGSYHFRLYPEE